ncbi:MAG TPA: iron-containing alcohol dehydrogenase, partial [Pyrinomonadaceae bacterium]|nr:iron-containing alcohol dehydrogenase [Pyrinomonadaceae bacterium]
MENFDFQPRTRVVFGSGSLARLGELARELGFRRSLVVADRGLMSCGYVEEAARLLKTNGVEVEAFHDFESDPDSRMVEAGREFSAGLRIDS